MKVSIPGHSKASEVQWMLRLQGHLSVLSPLYSHSTPLLPRVAQLWRVACKYVALLQGQILSYQKPCCHPHECNNHHEFLCVCTCSQYAHNKMRKKNQPAKIISFVYLRKTAAGLREDGITFSTSGCINVATLNASGSFSRPGGPLAIRNDTTWWPKSNDREY